MRRIAPTVLVLLQRIAVVVVLVMVAWPIYINALQSLFNRNDGNFFLPFLLFWLMTAYIVLPRIHRFLTKIYLPDYFIGRTRTGDGFYGDPVNVALFGTEKNLKAAMKAAGWTEADPLSMSSSIKMVKASVLKQSYPTAPVSSLYLFGRKQDFAFQQEINGNPHARHHVRFWKTPDNWYLPGGFRADWLAAGTYDERVGLSLFTLQITHKIGEHIDEERDHIIKTLQDAKKIKKLTIRKHFTDAYHSRNGGGDRIQTDGSLPFISL